VDFELLLKVAIPAQSRSAAVSGYSRRGNALMLRKHFGQRS